MNLPTKENLFREILLNNFKDNNLTIADATCGNGYDLEFLASNYNNSKIYALDIQSEALEISRNRCSKIKEDIIYEQINHLDFFKHSNNLFDIIIFNTGYLPGGDSNIKTNSLNTINTFKECFSKLNRGGIVCIMLYTAHDAYEENNEVVKYLRHLNKYHYIVFKYETINVNNSPILYLVEKK